MTGKKFRRLLSAILCVFLTGSLLSCTANPAEKIEAIEYFASPSPQLSEPITQDIVPVAAGRIIFEAAREDIPAILRDYELTEPEELLERTEDHNVFVTVCSLTVEKDIWSLAARLQSDTRIFFAEPDTFLEAQKYVLPNDPFLYRQTYLDAIGAKECWEMLNELGMDPGGSEDVIIAVLDSGVNYNHPDLKEKFTEDERGHNILNDSGDTFDSDGHGTNVTGVIAMIADNNLNGAGVAHNVKVLPVKTAPARSYSTSNIVKAIDYAVAQGADVINMSFGTYYDSPAIRNALEKASESCILVAAAGNEGIPSEGGEGAENPAAANFYPAALPFVIGVTAVDNKGEPPSWSNYNSSGDCVYEVAAPGKAIYTTNKASSVVYSSGTSLAAPIVSAAAALLRSRVPDEEKYPPELLTKWIQSADGGMLDMVKLLFETHEIPEESLPAALPLSIESIKETAEGISSQVTGGEAPYSYSFAVFLDGVRYFESPFSHKNYISYKPRQSGKYIVHVIVTDNAGHRKSSVFPWEISGSQ